MLNAGEDDCGGGGRIMGPASRISLPEWDGSMVKNMGVSTGPSHPFLGSEWWIGPGRRQCGAAERALCGESRVCVGARLCTSCNWLCDPELVISSPQASAFGFYSESWVGRLIRRVLRSPSAQSCRWQWVGGCNCRGGGAAGGQVKWPRSQERGEYVGKAVWGEEGKQRRCQGEVKKF